MQPLFAPPPAGSPARLTPEVLERLDSLHRLVGDTPLIELHCRARGRELSIWVKNEVASFTGSIKDRMALHMLERAYHEGGDRAGGHDRRGDQRQHRHRLRGHRPRARAPGARSTCRTG